MASLTEAAKAVLEGKVLEEGIPTVGSIGGGVSNPDPVQANATANAKTLKPKSGPVDADPKHNEAEDLGDAPVTVGGGENLGAKASKSKDTSKSSKSAVAAEPMKKLSMAEEMEDEGDVVEESETRLSIAERVKALKEARKADKEEDDSDDADDKDEMKSKKSEKKDDEDDSDDCNEDVEISEELEGFIAAALEEGLSEEEIIAAIDENFEFISEEDESLEEDALASYEVDMHEHVDALLAGENLSEEFHEKATVIFEAAVKAKLEEEVALLEQAYAETLEERLEEIQEQLAADVDDYLNYVIEQWIEENEVAVESALRSELTEDFISGLKSLFAEHYIDLPEEEVPVVEELSQTVEDLEARLNEEIQRNVELTSMLSEARKVELTAVVCEGLTDVQASKLQALAENVAYTTDEDFIEKVATLRESYFPVSVKADESIAQIEVTSDAKNLTEENLDGRMAAYAKALGRKLPN